MRDGNGSGLTGILRLHDIAAAHGDGLIPELYDLLTRPAPAVEIAGNVIPFYRRHDAPLNGHENRPHVEETAGSKN